MDALNVALVIFLSTTTLILCQDSLINNGTNTQDENIKNFTINKCCPEGQTLVDKICIESIGTSSEIPVTFVEMNGEDFQHLERNNNEFKIKKSIYDPNGTWRKQDYTKNDNNFITESNNMNLFIIQTGQLLEINKSTNQTRNFSSYCVDQTSEGSLMAKYNNLIPLKENKNIVLFKCCSKQQILTTDGCVESSNAFFDIPISFFKMYGTDRTHPKEVVNGSNSYKITPTYDEKDPWRKENDDRYETIYAGEAKNTNIFVIQTGQLMEIDNEIGNIVYFDHFCIDRQTNGRLIAMAHDRIENSAGVTLIIFSMIPLFSLLLTSFSYMFVPPLNKTFFGKLIAGLSGTYLLGLLLRAIGKHYNFKYDEISREFIKMSDFFFITSIYFLFAMITNTLWNAYIWSATVRELRHKEITLKTITTIFLTIFYLICVGPRVFLPNEYRKTAFYIPIFIIALFGISFLAGIYVFIQHVKTTLDKAFDHKKLTRTRYLIRQKSTVNMDHFEEIKNGFYICLLQLVVFCFVRIVMKCLKMKLEYTDYTFYTTPLLYLHGLVIVFTFLCHKDHLKAINNWMKGFCQSSTTTDSERPKSNGAFNGVQMQRIPEEEPNETNSTALNNI